MNKETAPHIEKELNLREFFFILWDKKFFVSILTTLFISIFSVYALFLPNFYTSKSLLSPAEREDSLSSTLGQISSLARFANLNLPNEGSSNAEEAIERVKTFEFFSKHLLPFIQLENIMAVKRWDAKQNKLLYKSSLFNSNSNEWVRKVSFPKQIVPSNQEAFEEFIKNVSIYLDNRTSLVSLSVKHQSQEIAKKWADLIIYQINEITRLEDISLAESYVDYLQESQKNTNFQFLKDASSKLLENQMETLMVASANKYYVFKIIDSPIISEKKSSPNRFLIIFIGALVGLIFSIALVFLRNLQRIFKR